MFDLDAFAVTNRDRCDRWHLNQLREWVLTDWSNAAAGEMGEVCNAVKKYNRHVDGIPGNAADADLNTLFDAVMKEIGDTAIYLDLLAQYMGVSLADCIVLAFNQVSERNGFPHRVKR